MATTCNWLNKRSKFPSLAPITKKTKSVQFSYITSGCRRSRSKCPSWNPSSLAIRGTSVTGKGRELFSYLWDHVEFISISIHFASVHQRTCEDNFNYFLTYYNDDIRNWPSKKWKIIERVLWQQCDFLPLSQRHKMVDMTTVWNFSNVLFPHSRFSRKRSTSMPSPNLFKKCWRNLNAVIIW